VAGKKKKKKKKKKIKLQIIFFPFLSSDTSRPKGDTEVDGRGYFFESRETMEKEIRENKYLDYGEYEGHLYGIKFSTVRAIVKAGRICVMAISPKVSGLF
jgi:guanylate kinase